ncbi:Na+/H+ antiporter subunit E [Candidatus Aerophobetes bacterium]|nr:Na+/H+ antiporter subunit E [Candidatus Aerophobetes bacterium]
MNVFLKWKIVRIILTSLYLMVGWILFTGSLALFSLFLGGMFSFLVALLTYSIFIEEKEAARRSLLPHIYLIVIYIFVLLFKIYLASFKMVFSVMKGNINPRIVHFRTRLKSDVARVILANSISLTPGTITLDLDEDHLIVHWLNAKTTHSHFASSLIKGHFEMWLRKIWI